MTRLDTRKKAVFSTELAYILGMALLCLGNAFMSLSNFGVGVVVSPAYVLHLKISEFLPFFSFGMAGYLLQGVLLLLLWVLTRHFKRSYLLSFATAVLAGFMLDGFILLLKLFSPATLAGRAVFFIVGMFIATSGIAFLFKTYITQEAYDLFVMELGKRFSLNINKVKITYDISSFVLAIVLALFLFGISDFRGIGVGTVVSACFNGLLIAMYGRLYDKLFTFEDKLQWRNFFKR